MTDVTWTRPNDEGTTEEFSVPRTAAEEVSADVDPVFDLGERRVLRLERERTTDCACETVEHLGYPVDDVQAVDGTLLVTLNLVELDDLQGIVTALGETADRVEVRYLVHDRAEAEGERPVVVDRGRLTDRQREVLRTAFRMGYFEYPRNANATAVAEELDIDLSTFAEHLATAQAKLLDGVVNA